MSWRDACSPAGLAEPMRPERVRTLLELLELRATISPDGKAFTIGEETVTFARLWAGVNRFAAMLRQRGVVRGDRVVVALANGPDFFSAFYGAQRAGGIAVPLFPGSGVGHVLAMAGICGAAAVVLPKVNAADPAQPGTGVAGRPGPLVVSVPDSAGFSDGEDFPAVDAKDVAFIQYTSGSTGRPKGVMLSHANLLTNVRQMIAGMRMTESEIFVSWLPVYHDMGLILMTMAPLYLAAPLFLLQSRLGNVRLWLDTISRQRGTFTAAPDIAYRLCLRYVRDPRAYDLTCLRVALNAAEPVRQATVLGFERAFGLKNVMMPAYGLAEATVGVSMCTPGEKVGADGRGCVSVGTPFPGVAVKIVREGREVPPGETGEIVVRSLAAPRGYFRDPVQTRRVFGGRHGIRTGDVGHLDERGELYVVGRLKNIIITGGRNIAPREIEEIVEALAPVRRSAAVGIDRGGIEGEQAYVFAELRARGTPAAGELERLSGAVVQAFKERFGFRPGRVCLLAPGAIPVTPNGKIRYGRLKERYLGHELRDSGQLLFPGY